MPKRRIALLGATGSIGKSARDVLLWGRDDFEVVLLAARRDREGLDRAGREWPDAVRVLTGEEGGERRLLSALADCGADLTLNGIAGAAGLAPSFAALDAGSSLALANKETLVMAGPLATDLAKRKSLEIVPVDSEHAALFSLIAAHGGNGGASCIAELILTASGGPFRNRSLADMGRATVADALAHPTWKMGRKISVDSASMANKGLEVIEAAVLFGFPPERIKVVIHPQSVVHSMLRMEDGAVYAQLSPPDMRHPIRQALYRSLGPGGKGDLPGLDFGSLTLEFFPPDMERFPLLALAYRAAESGGLYPCAYNAANEVAVSAFLAGRIGFLDMAALTEYTLGQDWSVAAESLDAVLDADLRARTVAEERLASFG